MTTTRRLAIVDSIRAGLVMQLKQAVGGPAIRARGRSCSGGDARDWSDLPVTP